MIYRAFVTLCSLRDPLGFKTTPITRRDRTGAAAGTLRPHERRGGSPPPRVCLRVLGGDDGGGQSPVNVGGGARTVLQLIMAGDPFDLTGLQVRAHCQREQGHRSEV